MALIDEINKLDLSDDAKQLLIREHTQESTATATELSDLRRAARKTEVENEVAMLSDGPFKGQPGILKYVRRVLLSDDQEPGTVLLSDSDLGLSGDAATGATAREEVSTADVLRGFINLLPKGEDGKIQFSDQALIENAGDPPGSGEEETDEEKSAAASKRLGGITGFTGECSRKRYQRTAGGVS